MSTLQQCIWEEVQTMTELEKLIKSYLESVDTVLLIFKRKVGAAREGKSWKANIADMGEYMDSGISSYYRHGSGIQVDYNGKIIDFDFCDLNFLDLDDDYKFITIDVGFLATFIESSGVKNMRWTDYSLLKEDLDEMVEKGILKKIEYEYYLTRDLDHLQRQ